MMEHNLKTLEEDLKRNAVGIKNVIFNDDREVELVNLKIALMYVKKTREELQNLKQEYLESYQVVSPNSSAGYLLRGRINQIQEILGA